MGAHSSKEYLYNLEFFKKLFGPVREVNGIYEWTTRDLSGKTLFGKPVCFDSVILAKDPDMIHIRININIKNVIKNLKGNPYVAYSGKSIGTISYSGKVFSQDIIMLRKITDDLLGKPLMVNVNDISLDNTKNSYIVLCQNVSILSKKRENFVPIMEDGGYISNNPLNVALTELTDEKYYNSLDTDKKTERFLPIKKNPLCVGACEKRFNQMLKTLDTSEHLVSQDPRFVPYNTLIYYDTDSDVNTIDRTFGTVDQKIDYPKLSNLFYKGIAGVSK